MASQTRSPGTMANDTSVGTKQWEDVDNAKINDGNTAVASASFDNPWTTNYLKATNFGFSIPTGATIDGILVQIEERDGGDSGSIFDNRVSIVKSNGIVGTDNKAKSPAWTALTTYTDYGGVLIYGASRGLLPILTIQTLELCYL